MKSSNLNSSQNTLNTAGTEKNVHIISLGCARNLVDSEVMAGLLNKGDYAITGEAENADVIIVNTCGFIDEAKKESIDSILEAAQYKDPEKGRCQKLVVTGCLSERYPSELKESLPEVDLITGTAAFSKIVEELESLDVKSPSLRTADASPIVKIHKDRLKDYELPRMNSQASFTAYLKLAEGCAKRCSFCIIPKLRGPLRSRSVETLLGEAHDLVQSGVRELNLIAQDLTDYGRDRKDGADLPKLLRGLVKQDGLDWIRLFYLYPDQLDEEVLNIIKNEQKICKYLDIPIQHINDKVLRNMNRKASGTQVREMVQRLREEIPGVVLRTSLMVGFPGETEEQFAELLDFVKTARLDQVGVFTYSREEGTASYKFGDPISQRTKNARKAKIMRVQEKIQDQLLEKWMGKSLSVLVQGPHEDTPLLLKARHYGQAPDVDNCTLINKGEARIGEFVQVRITERAGLDLVAEVIE